MKKRNISLVMSFLLLFSACSEQIISTVEYSNEKVLTDELIINNASEEYINYKGVKEYRLKQEIKLNNLDTYFESENIFPFYKKEDGNKTKFYSIYTNLELTNKEFTNVSKCHCYYGRILEIVEADKKYVYDIFGNAIYEGDEGELSYSSDTDYTILKVGDKEICYKYLEDGSIKMYDNKFVASNNEKLLTSYGEFLYTDKLDLTPYGLENYSIENIGIETLNKHFPVYKKDKIQHTIYLKNNEHFLDILGQRMLISKRNNVDTTEVIDFNDVIHKQYKTEDSFYLIDIKTGEKNKLDANIKPWDIYPLKDKNNKYKYYVCNYSVMENGEYVSKQSIIDENFVIYEDLNTIDEGFKLFNKQYSKIENYLFKLNDEYLFNKANSTVYDYNLNKIKDLRTLSEEDIVYTNYLPNNQMFGIYKEKYGVVDMSWNVIVPMEYDDIYYEEGINGCFVARSGVDSYFINTKTNEKTRVSDLRPVSENLFYYTNPKNNKEYISSSDMSFTLEVTSCEQLSYEYLENHILYYIHQKRDGVVYKVISPKGFN